MKLRKIMAGLWIVLLLLVGTCYAENTENPIVYENNNIYYRLIIPSVKKDEYVGHSCIRFQYTQHSLQAIPFFGTPFASEDGKGWLWIDPSKEKLVIKNDNGWFFHYKEFNDVESAMYNFIKSKFPNLVNEVIADNKIIDAKFGKDLENAEAVYDSYDWDMLYDSLKKVYDNGCQSASIINYLAETSMNLLEYDAAIDWYSKRIDINPSAAAYNRRAWLYYLLGKNDLALSDANWAVSKDKENSNILDTRGSIYYAMGQYDKAIADFDAAIKNNDKLAHAYYYRGKSYEALGKKSDAQSDYKKAKKLDLEITDDKEKFEKQRSQNQVLKQQRQQKKQQEQQQLLQQKQQEQQQRLAKYKNDLKKLNDAVYVHNNAEQYPEQVVYESDDLIITVVGRILKNEPKEFYQEVVPQEVRTNYENRVYQQKVEELKDKVVPVKPKTESDKKDNSSAGSPEVTRPATTSVQVEAPKPGVVPDEKYDLSDKILEYTTDGSKYILSWESPLLTINEQGLYGKGDDIIVLDRPHGKYIFKDELYATTWGGGADDFSFNYNSDTQTFDIYDGQGLSRHIRYNQGDNTLIVDDCLDSAYSGTYVYDSSLPGYILYGVNSKIHPAMAALVTEPFYGDGSLGTTYKVSGRTYDVDLYPENKEKGQKDYGLPEMWYKITPKDSGDDWIAFSYDTGTGNFTMYRKSRSCNEVENYAKRKFLDKDHLQTWDDVYFGKEPLILTRNEYGGYDDVDHPDIIKYITDGMWLIQNYVKR